MALIIVESPTKARTFNRILDPKKYFVFATLGHIRDLPTNKISVDYEKSFKPNYQIMRSKKKVVDQLKDLAKKNAEIILATDLDREGESISYHVAYLLGFIKEKWPEFDIKDTGNNLKRIVFHEITKSALSEALENPQELRINLVKAQQARRILDRVVGYELSPLLWKKMGKNWLSAGRVQTVALRLIVEREKEIKVFKSEPYFQLYGSFKNSEVVRGKLIKKNDIPYEQSFKLTLFDGEYTFTKTTIDTTNIESIKSDLQSDSYTVSEISEAIVKRYPPPPFTTSLLQQEGFHKFGFSSRMTMKLAQDLYERGLITYHRTDSFNLSTQFVFRAKDYITEKFGSEYALEKPRGFKTRSKMAQEAHEAIRPTHLDTDTKSFGDKHLTVNHKKLYSLIFDRAICTQMKEAEIKQVKIFISGKKGYVFEADLQQVLFDGFLKVLNPEFVKKNLSVSHIKENESVRLDSLEPLDSTTKPPSRYNEASLIKSLEEKGIGRPSTYAPIITLIQEKNYVEKINRYFNPTNLGEAISDYLSKAFPQLFDINFTAEMEKALDEIADGNRALVQLLSDFYTPFKKELEIQKKDKKVIDVEEEIKEKCPKCQGNLTVRFSKFGRFLACSNYPACKFTKPFLQFVPNKTCPKCSGKLVIRFTKTRKRFYGCEKYPECTYSAWKLS